MPKHIFFRDIERCPLPATHHEYNAWRAKDDARLHAISARRQQILEYSYARLRNRNKEIKAMAEFIVEVLGREEN